MAEYGGNPEAEKQPGKIYTNQKIDNCNFFWGWNIRFIHALNNEYYTFWYDGDNRLCDKYNYINVIKNAGQPASPAISTGSAK